MKSYRRRFFLFGAAGLCTAALTGTTSAAGVMAGASSLFNTPDYSDTFTGTDSGGIPGRPYVASPLLSYAIENTHGNPAANYIHQPGSAFSIAADFVGTNGFVQGGTPPYPVLLGPNASGAGSDTGFTQTGGNNLGYGVSYGLRNEYVVQVDMVQVTDRVDITSGGMPPAGHIAAPNSISVFFRGDGSGNASIYNGVVDTPIRGQPGYNGFNTGIAAWNASVNGGQSRWYNYAVRFDQPDNEIELYVNEVSLGVIDLDTFAGGIYSAGFSNQFVGVSSSTGDRTWTDNFQVGGNPTLPPTPALLPNPGVKANLPAGLVSFWDFDEASGPVPGNSISLAYDRAGGGNHGGFTGIATRTAGLVGTGAARFQDTNGEGVFVGPGIGNNFASPGGITIETLFTTNYNGTDQSEFFRKEDGGNRILLSFQSNANIVGNATSDLIGVEAGVAGISLGLNIGGTYREMDVQLDGIAGRPTLAQLADGSVHHLVASYDAATGVRSMYIDGVLVGMVDGADGLALNAGGAAAAYIGADRNVEPFAGTLDEFAIWNRALSPLEIQTHFANVQAGNNYFVPEPGTMTMAALGALGLCALRLRRRK